MNREESNLRQLLLHSELKRKLDLQPHEDKLKDGIPDMSFTNGWIELKVRKRWPVKSDGIVTIDHFTPAQRQWARRRANAGQPCWMLLQVGIVGMSDHVEYLLFGEGYWRWVGELTRSELCAKTRGLMWRDVIDFKAMGEHLQAGWCNGYPGPLTMTYPAPR